MTTANTNTNQQVSKSALPTTSAQGVTAQAKGKNATAAPCVYTSNGRVYTKRIQARKSISLLDILMGRA